MSAPFNDGQTWTSVLLPRDRRESVGEFSDNVPKRLLRRDELSCRRQVLRLAAEIRNSLYRRQIFGQCGFGTKLRLEIRQRGADIMERLDHIRSRGVDLLRELRPEIAGLLVGDATLQVLG